MSNEVSSKTQMKKSTGKAKKITKKQLEAQNVQSGGGEDHAPVEEAPAPVAEAQAPVAEEQSAGGKKTKSKKEKGPKKPRAKTAYNFFVSENMKTLMKLDEWKDKKNSELMKECGVRWKSCSDSDKAPYQQMSTDHKKQLESQNV